MMGTDYVMERDNGAPLNNPLHEDTQILTLEYGWVALKDIEGQDVSVLTSTHDYGSHADKVVGSGANAAAATWASARISHTEVQPTKKIVFEDKDGNVTEITASDNHRWYRRRHSTDWERVTTLDLNVGDYAPIVKPQKYYTLSKVGQQHGFFFGDGTRSNGELHQFADSIPVLQSLFGDTQVIDLGYHEVVRHLPLAWGKLPEGEYVSDSKYLYGFLSGYFAADGHVDQMGNASLASSRLEELTAVAEMFRRVGVRATEPRVSIEAGSSNNFSDSRNALYEIKLTAIDLRPDFFLKESHRTRWEENLGSRRRDWAKVVGVSESGESNVLCAEVPGYEQFVTEGFILTSNCAFISTEELHERSAYPFTFLMDMSMLGVGVGFDTDGAGAKVPGPIRRPEGDRTTVHIPDSREGWVWSIEMLLESYLQQKSEVDFDYSRIRKQGEPIKGFGGTASGPAPLKKLHERMRIVLDGATERGHITSRDIVDIQNMIGACVVAGNVRRSAELALGEADDEEFLNLKNYERNPERVEWGWASNNTLTIREGQEVDYEAIAERIADNGEPGLFYIDAARKFGRMGDEPDFGDMRVKGTNPCVTGSTWVTTVDGPRQVRELIGNRVNLVVDGKEYKTVSEGFWHTGVKPVYLLSTFEGYQLELTRDHRVLTENRGWVEAGDLVYGDSIVVNKHTNNTWSGNGTVDHGYLAGLLVGDGYINNGKARLLTWAEDDGIHQESESAMRRAFSMRDDFNGWSGPYGNGWYSMMTAEFTRFCDSIGLLENKSINQHVERMSSDFYVGFLRGMFDADGHVEGYDNGKGISVRLTTVSADNAYATQRMLGRLGILSKVYHSERNDGYGSERTEYRVCITSESAREFSRIVGFHHRNKQARIDAYFDSGRVYKKPFVAQFAGLEYVGYEDVYDVTVDEVHAFDANGLYVHNCAEQMLESGELCTLVEVFPSRATDIVDFLRTLKFAYLYAKTVTLVETHDERTNEVMRRNRRIGTSVSGMVQFVNRSGKDVLEQYLRAGYGYINNLDRKYSRWLGIPESVRKTTVKPSGTVSLLAGATPGVHYPTADYYIRRIRLQEGHPLVDKLSEAGYHIEPDQYSDNTVVVEMPVKGEGLPTEMEVSIFDKADLATFMAEHWSDNGVSCTITFQPHEAQCIETVLRNNEGKWKTASFLPISKETFPQMPYEEITKEQYEDMVRDLKPVGLAGATDGEMELYCETDVCEIRYVGAEMEVITEEDSV